MGVTWIFRGPILVVKLAGSYRLEEMQQVTDAALASPERPATVGLLIDARESLANPELPEIEQRAFWLAALPGAGVLPRFATITSPERFRYGLTRMLEALVSSRGCELRIFTGYDEAVAWLWSLLQSPSSSRE